MRKLLFILLSCLITTSALGQFQQKPMLGEQINWAHPLSKGLVGYWLLNEGSGNVFDLSGNGNAGTLVADTHWVPGKFGSVLDFDGTGDNVNCGQPSVLDFGTGNFTLSIWVKSTQSTRGGLIDKYTSDDNGWSLDINGAGDTGRLRFLIKGGANYRFKDTTTTVGDGNWHHIVAVRTGDDVDVYIDSIKDGAAQTSNGGSPNVDYNIDVTFGFDAYAAGFYFTGQLDMPLIYNRVLAASEIALLYREPFCMFQRDDIAMLEAGIPAPPAGGGQVITINMTMIPLFLIFTLVCFIKERK